MKAQACRYVSRGAPRFVSGLGVGKQVFRERAGCWVGLVGWADRRLVEKILVQSCRVFVLPVVLGAAPPLVERFSFCSRMGQSEDETNVGSDDDAALVGQ